MHKQSVSWRKRLGLGLVLAGVLAIAQAHGQATTSLAAAASQASGNPTTAPASQPVDKEYVKEFGIEKSQPYDKVFLFWRGRYVDTPIVVERRGLSVYINNIKVIGKSSRFPPRDMRVLEDPGEPPKDQSPWQAVTRDEEINWYWLKKWHYLCGQMEFKDSVQAIAEVFKKSKGVTEVVVNEAEQGQLFRVRITADGQTYTLAYSQHGYLAARSAPDRQAAAQRELEDMQSGYKEWCQELADGGFWFAFGLADTKVDKRKGIEIIRTLEANLTWDEKVAKLEPLGLKPGGGLDMLFRLKNTYTGSPQLLQRIRDLEAQWARTETQPSAPVKP